MNSIANALAEATFQMATARRDYYNQWMFDEPFWISKEEDHQLKQLQLIMHKMINQFVVHYDKWEHLMPVSPASRRIINAFSSKEYKSGTYRVDTVFDADRQQKIIEITCRFALNGLFIAAIANQFARQYHNSNCPETSINDRFPKMFDHLGSLIGNHKKIILLRNADGRNASKFFLPLLEQIGLEVVIIQANEVANRLDEVADGFIINELAIEEVEQIPDELLAKMVKMDMVNDLRTVILIHDKRFFDVMGNPDFQNAILTEEEIKHFALFHIPTHRYGHAPEAWKAARENKNDWIIKHRSLGKSQEVYAGEVCSVAEWDALFERPDRDQLIIQRWIKQPQFSGTVNGTAHNDYVTGTLLFFDEHFFGSGIFRASSFPVTNVVDDRKMFSLTKA